MSYFAIERNQQCVDHVVIKDKNDRILFGDYLNTTYDEMKSREDLNEFVVAVMDATGKKIVSTNDQTIVTLVDDDDIFVWSIIIGTVDGDDGIKYALIDWKKDGNNYRYVPENKDLTN
jgi:hypothetical protein